METLGASALKATIWMPGPLARTREALLREFRPTIRTSSSPVRKTLGRHKPGEQE